MFILKWLIVLSVLNNARASGVEENNTKSESDTEEALKPDTLRSKREPYHDYLHYLIEKHAQCADQHLTPLRPDGLFKPYDMFVYPYGLSQSRADIARQSHQMQNVPGQNIFPTYHNPLKPSEYATRRPASNQLANFLNFASPSYLKIPDCDSNRSGLGFKNQPRYKGQQRTGGTKSQRKFKPSRKNKKPITTSLDPLLQRGSSSKNSSQVVIVNVNVNNCKSMKDSLKSGRSETKDLKNLSNKDKPENSTYLCSSCLANSKANRTDSVSRHNIDSVKFPCSSCAARSGDSIKGMTRTNDTVTRNTSVSPASTEQNNSGKTSNSAQPKEDTYSSLAPDSTSSPVRRNKANGLQIIDESFATTPYSISATTTKELKSSRPYASTEFSSTKTDLSNPQTEIGNNQLNPYPVTTPLPITKLSKDTNINLQSEVSPKDQPAASLVASQDTNLATIETRQLVETTTTGVQELLGEDQLNTEAIAKQNRPEKGYSSKSEGGILQKETVARTFNISSGNAKIVETPRDHFEGISNHTGVKPNSKSSKGLVTINNGSNNLDEEATPSKFDETSREEDLNRNNAEMKSNGQHDAESQVIPETFPAELGKEFADHNATTQRPADIINIPVQNNGKFEIIQLPQNVAGSKPGSVRQELDKFFNDGNKPKQDSNVLNSNEQLGPGENVQPDEVIELRLTSNSSQQGNINFGTGSVPHQKDQINVISPINDNQSSVSDIETTMNNDEPEEPTRSVLDIKHLETFNSSTSLKDPQTTTVSEAKGHTLSKSNRNDSTEFVHEPKEFVSHGFVLDAYKMGKEKLPMKPKSNIEEIEKLLKIESSKPHHNQREGEKVLAIVKNQQRESLEALSNSNEHDPAELILNAREKEDSFPHDQRELLELISESKSEGHHVFLSNLHKPGLDRDKGTINITGSGSSKPTSSSQLISLSRNEQQIPVKVIYETNEGDGHVLPSNSTVSEAIEPILDSHGQAEVKLFTFSSKSRNKPVSGFSIAKVIRGKGNATYATPNNETGDSELFNPQSNLDSKEPEESTRQAEVKLAVLSETNPIQRKITSEMSEPMFLTESNKDAAISSESFEHVDIGGESFSTKPRQVPAEIISEGNQQPPVDSQENVRLSTIVNENREGNSSLGDKENRQSTEKVFSFSKIKDTLSSNDAETDVGKIPNSRFKGAVKMSSFAKTKQIENGHIKAEGKVKHISFSRGSSQEPHEPLAHSDINERTQNLQDHIQEALNLFSSNSKNNHDHSTLSSNSNIQGSIKHFTFRHKNKQDSAAMVKDEAQPGKPLEGAVKIVSFSISKQQEPKASNGREAIVIKKDNIPNADRSSIDSNIKWPWIFNSQANRTEQVENLFNSGFKEANINDHSALENESTKSRPTDMTGTDTKFVNYMQIPKGRSLINEPIITEIYPGRRSKSRSPPSIYWHTIEPRTEAIARTIKELRPFMSPDFEDVRDDFDNDSKESLDYDEIYEDENEPRLRPNFPELINVKNIQ